MHYSSSHPTAFGFHTSLPPDNITLNPANKKTDQSLSCFQTGIGEAVHAILDVEHLISHTRTALVVTITSLLGSDGGVITASEMHELFTKTRDILNSAVCKWGGTVAHILASLFKSDSRKHCEVWVSQFPFIHNIKYTVDSDACLYRYINWSLTQAGQQSSLGLPQSSTSMRGARAKQRDWAQA